MSHVHDRTMWRRVLAADLGLFNAALFAFAAIPPETIVPLEGVAMFLSGVALIGVIAHACRAIHLPGENYSYLVTSMVGVYVLLGYLTSPGVLYQEIPIALFLCSGIASGLAAHVIDGGPEHCG
jgi:hypothetical protein